MTYEKRFRLSVVVKYESEEPLGAVDELRAQARLQAMVDYALDKYAEMPINDGPVEIKVERPEPARSVRELVESIKRALERKGFDVT